MAKLARSVFVREPGKHRDILLRAGEEPAPELAALILNPACWEGGKLPGTPEDEPDDQKSQDTSPDQGDDSEDTKPAARKPAAKKTAARKPAAN